jgi:GAF domain-containing protein
VPLLKKDQFIGCIAIYRKEVRPFSDKQIALVTSFANQAVIAIENTRLLNELRQRTDELGRSVGELRALGEVSQAVNSTLDLETVLSTIVAKAVQLSNTEAGAIYVFDEVEHNFRLRATYGMDRELIDALKNEHIGRAECQPCTGRADLDHRFEPGTLHARERGGPARRLSRPLGCAARPRGGHRWHAGGAPARTRRLPAEHRRPDEDIGRAIGAGDPKRALVRKRRNPDPRTGEIVG